MVSTRVVGMRVVVNPNSEMKTRLCGELSTALLPPRAVLNHGFLQHHACSLFVGHVVGMGSMIGLSMTTVVVWNSAVGRRTVFGHALHRRRHVIECVGIVKNSSWEGAEFREVSTYAAGKQPLRRVADWALDSFGFDYHFAITSVNAALHCVTVDRL